MGVIRRAIGGDAGIGGDIWYLVIRSGEKLDTP